MKSDKTYLTNTESPICGLQSVQSQTKSIYNSQLDGDKTTLRREISLESAMDCSYYRKKLTFIIQPIVLSSASLLFSATVW